MIKVKMQNGKIEIIKDYVRTRKINSTDTVVDLMDGSTALLLGYISDMEYQEIEESKRLENAKAAEFAKPLHDWFKD